MRNGRSDPNAFVGGVVEFQRSRSSREDREATLSRGVTSFDDAAHRVGLVA